MKAARRLGRHGERDAAMVLLMFRHGLRTAELVALKWSQVDLKRGYLDVKRAKGGNDSKHPLRGPQLRASGSYSESTLNRPTFSYRSGGHLSRRDLFGTSSLAPGKKPGLTSRFTLISSGTPVATFSPQRGTTPERSRTTWGTETSTTRSGTPKWLRSGSRASGKISEIPQAITAEIERWCGPNCRFCSKATRTPSTSVGFGPITPRGPA